MGDRLFKQWRGGCNGGGKCSFNSGPIINERNYNKQCPFGLTDLVHYILRDEGVGASGRGEGRGHAILQLLVARVVWSIVLSNSSNRFESRYFKVI